MRLNDEERAMLAGKLGRVPQIAIEHQIKVGDFFGAERCISLAVIAGFKLRGILRVELVEQPSLRQRAVYATHRRLRKCSMQILCQP